MCAEVRRCYNDTNICLWTDDSWLNQSAAKSVCQQRDSFLPLVTNSNIQSKMGEFRTAAWDLLHASGFWIDVKAVDPNSWHWIDGSSLAGHFIYTRICCIQSASWLKGAAGRSDHEGMTCRVLVSLTVGKVWKGPQIFFLNSQVKDAGFYLMHFYCEKLLVARNRDWGWPNWPH